MHETLRSWKDELWKKMSSDKNVELSQDWTKAPNDSTKFYEIKICQKFWKPQKGGKNWALNENV
jgi:hypothetical protein